VLNGTHGLAMAGQHLVTELGAIGWAIVVKDIRQFGHRVIPPTTWSIVSAAESLVFSVSWV
jgi:hypothetical protein